MACTFCGKSLVPFKKDWKDWETRQMHKTCYKKYMFELLNGFR